MEIIINTGDDGAVINARVRQKTATLAEWQNSNLVLLDGEQAFVLGPNGEPINFKIGDGTKTFNELPFWIQYDQGSFVPVNGTTLPTLDAEETNYSIVGPGTYTQTVGGDVVVPENSLGIIVWGGDEWVLGSVVTIPAPVGVDEIDPDGENLPKEKAVAKYTYSKEEYVFHNLVDSVEPNMLRENGTEVVDPTRRLELLKKLDSALTGLYVTGLNPDDRMCLTRFTFRPDDNIVNFELAVAKVGESKEPGEYFTGNISYSGNSLVVTRGLYRETVSYSLELDLSGMGGNRLDFQFYPSNTYSYEKSGLKDSFIQRLKTPSFWGSGFHLNSGETNNSIGEGYHVLNSVKSISVTGGRKELVALQQIGWSPGNNALMFIIVTCIDDDEEDFQVRESRNGFSYLRVYVPENEIGVKRFTSIVFSGSSKTTVEIVIDCDYLNEKIPDFVTFQSLYTKAPIDDNRITNWIVKPSSGGGGGGFFSQLTLLDGSDDFEGNYSFNSSGNNWSYNANYNMSKLIRIPDGANEIQFNMQFGANANADWIDENLKRIGKVHSGNNTVSNIKVDIPNDARFIRACTQTDVNEASIIAYGEMEISGQVNTYRSLHEGLGDKYSGKIFKVGEVVFEKDIDGLCTLYEYKSLNSFNDSIPEFELDGSKLQPLNVPYTGNNGTFDYGSFCAEKDGVLYFYNARACAVFKTEDYGQTYTTISDKFSHPDLWDTEDVNSGQTSGVVVPLSDGEILFQVRHRGDKFIDEQNSQRKERFFILCRTKNNQTDAEKVLTFSHEDTLRHWLDPSDPQYNYPNHSGGLLLSDFTHDIWNDLIVVAEYGSGTSYYWQEKGVANNARGISGRAWASLDGGLTWKKFFDADRKINGLTEDDENWYWFTSTEARKMCHLHGIFIDKVNGTVHITNGDSEDYDWSVKVSDLKAWYQGAPSVDPDEHPEYKTTDTFPATDSFMFTHNDERWHNAYSFMKPQQMAGTPIEGGLLWGHDASREFAYVSRKTDSGEMIEPVFPFEYIDDYDTIQEFVASWGSTDGFVQDIKVIDGVIFFIHSHSKTPNRIWASRDGYNWKIALEVPVDTFGFGAKIFKSNGSFYVSNKQTLADDEIGYWKLKEV